MIKTRMTVQKLKILEYLKSVKTHPTAEQVYNIVKKEIPTLTLATVYRNLNQLADSHQILRIKFNNEYHFDADMCFHQHCVCDKCGSISDAFLKKITKNSLVDLDADGFAPKSIMITFHGLCKECKEVKKDDNKN